MCLATCQRAAVVIVLLGGCAAPHPTRGTAQPVKAVPSGLPLESGSQPPTRNLPCRFGRPNPNAKSVSLAQLVETPDQYVDQRIRVVGYVLDLHERSFLVNPVGGHSVWANWSQYDLQYCRRKEVVADGVFRRAPPGVRHTYAIDVEGMRDVEAVGR
jgi:hypothetical protein